MTKKASAYSVPAIIFTALLLLKTYLYYISFSEIWDVVIPVIFVVASLVLIVFLAQQKVEKTLILSWILYLICDTLMLIVDTELYVLGSYIYDFSDLLAVGILFLFLLLPQILTIVSLILLIAFTTSKKPVIKNRMLPVIFQSASTVLHVLGFLLLTGFESEDSVYYIMVCIISVLSIFWFNYISNWICTRKEEMQMDSSMTNYTPFVCMHCGAELDPNQKFCSVCGAQVGNSCLYCGHALNNNEMFCPSCGTKQY